MTPDAYESDWVQNELARAKRKKKPLFPLLLEGDVWLAVEATQYINVKGGQLPPPQFYDRLAAYSPRQNEAITLEVVEDEAVRFSASSQWAQFGQPGVNDFYGIAMYALSLEAEGEHDEAVRQLKRADKLESRIKNRKWMTTYYEWTEIENRLLEQILTNTNF